MTPAEWATARMERRKRQAPLVPTRWFTPGGDKIWCSNCVAVCAFCQTRDCPHVYRAWTRVRCAECQTYYEYNQAFDATRFILRRVTVAIRAGEQERLTMGTEAIVRPMAKNDEIGINRLLQDSYSIFTNVVNGRVTPATASAAARNCGNVLKGLELRAKYGDKALKF